MEISYRWSESAVGLAIGPKLKRSFLLCNAFYYWKIKGRFMFEIIKTLTFESYLALILTVTFSFISFMPVLWNLWNLTSMGKCFTTLFASDTFDATFCSHYCSLIIIAALLCAQNYLCISLCALSLCTF